MWYFSPDCLRCPASTPITTPFFFFMCLVLIGVFIAIVILKTAVL